MYKLQQIVIVGHLVVYWLSDLTGKTLLRIIIKFFIGVFVRMGPGWEWASKLPVFYMAGSDQCDLSCTGGITPQL